MVVLDRGTFLTGTLILRSHVELHLTSTAVLKGVADIAQYHADPKVVYKLLNRSLIFAEGCEHVAITGQGTIDGQGKAFPATDKDPRPVLIRLRDCHDVRLEGFLVKNSPSFGVHPIHCRQMRIEGLRIDSRVQPNSDGIDIDGCQDVFISNCNIQSGDDSIALKTIERGEPCRDIVITNCVLSSACAAIRVGPRRRDEHRAGLRLELRDPRHGHERRQDPDGLRGGHPRHGVLEPGDGQRDRADLDPARRLEAGGREHLGRLRRQSVGKTKHLFLNNVRFHLEAEDLRPAVVCDDVQNLELTGLKADGSPKAESLIRLQDTQAVLISGSRLLQPLRNFLRVEGRGSQRIVLKGNDLHSPRLRCRSLTRCRRMRSASTRTLV